jgi:uncharacterized membrane protein YccC
MKVDGNGSCARGVDWRDWRDRWNAADPGWNQLRKAARATLSAIVSTFVLFRLIQWIHQPRAVAFIGILISILGVMLVSDPIRRQQRTTTLLVPIPAMLSVTLGTLVATTWWLNNIVFAAVIFVSVLLQQFGPRFVALGFVLFIAYFDALFFHAQVSEIPWLLIGIIIGAALAYAIRFWIWPDRPRRILTLTALAYRGQLRRVCRELARLALSDKWTRRDDRRLGKLNGKLTEVALALERAAVAVGDPWRDMECHPDFRQWVLETELAVESMGDPLRQLVSSGALTPELKRELHGTICRVLEVLREDKHRLPASALRDSLVGKQFVNTQGEVEVQHFNETILDLADVLDAQCHLEFEPRIVDDTARPAEPQPPVASKLNKMRPRDFRSALQATAAGVASMLCGQMISRQRWYWAVLAAFVVFMRTNTSSETMVRAWQRVLGTIVGVVVGIGLGEAVKGHQWLQLVLIYVCIFFAYLLIRISYAWTIIWFTLLLSVLYSLLGLLTPGLLELRLLLTVVGAAVGVLCARFVLPSHTGEKVRAAAIAVLEACAKFLDKGVVGESTVEQARQVDQRRQELREAVMPLEQRFLPVEGREQMRLVDAVTAVAFFTRQLARNSQRGTAVRLGVTEPARRLSEKIDALIRSLNEKGASSLDCDVLLHDRLQCASQRRDSEAARVVHWLRQIDHELLRIADLTCANA